MKTVASCYLLPAGTSVVHGRPIVAVEADLARRMSGFFGGLTSQEIAEKLADLPWIDAEDEGLPPGEMWWTLVQVLDPDGVTEVHLQAEPVDEGVVVYLPGTGGGS